MSKLKIIQTKSSIKKGKNQKANLEALGLKKIGQSVEHKETPVIKGMIGKVEHLVKVEAVK
jgi:large subunit ribosomal protein L30